MAAPKLVPRLDLEEGETLLDYLLHPDKLAGVLTQRRDLQAGLDAKIAGLGTLQEADALRDQAAVARDEAAQLRRSAAEAVAAASQTVEESRRVGEALLTTARSEAESGQQNSRATLTRLGTWEAELVNRERVIGTRERELTRRESVAAVAQEAADTLRRDLEQKLAAFQAMMRKG